jgi:aryl-alcohol dehydrogenase-like predicted oxidoreductase
MPVHKRLGTLRSTSPLGLRGMTGMYGPADRGEGIATIRTAVDAGISLLDTGDFYGMGDNEVLLREAIDPFVRDKVQLSVKFGAMRGPDLSWLGYDTRPVAVKNFLTYTLKRLGTDYIDIYRPAGLDPEVPVEDTVGAIAEMVQAGYVRNIGLTDVDAHTIRRAHAVHPLSDVQLEYSVICRGAEGGVLATCRELGIGVTASGVLARGLHRHPVLLDRLCAIAGQLGATVAQIAIAWLSAQGDDIVPLVTARTRATLEESLGAVDVTLTTEQRTAIDEVVAVAA